MSEEERIRGSVRYCKFRKWRGQIKVLRKHRPPSTDYALEIKRASVGVIARRQSICRPCNHQDISLEILNADVRVKGKDNRDGQEDK